MLIWMARIRCPIEQAHKGLTYEGQWRKGKRHGWSMCTMQSGNLWAGMYLSAINTFQSCEANYHPKIAHVPRGSSAVQASGRTVNATGAAVCTRALMGS